MSTAVAPRGKRLGGLVLAVALLLLVPLIAMQFTDEVRWSPFDFLVAGVLLLGAGLFCELVWRLARTTGLRIFLCAVVLSALALVWLELAVGLFGTPFAGS